MATSASPICSRPSQRLSSVAPRWSAGVLVLTEINTLLIGLGFQPSAVQAALGLIIVLLVSLYGRERHVSTTI
jgi:ribose/xylose/arabinose/galactoside ABC-type transport system permease subunit